MGDSKGLSRPTRYQYNPGTGGTPKWVGNPQNDGLPFGFPFKLNQNGFPWKDTHPLERTMTELPHFPTL